jgi:hypothetical protein
MNRWIEYMGIHLPHKVKKINPSGRLDSSNVLDSQKGGTL